MSVTVESKAKHTATLLCYLTPEQFRDIKMAAAIRRERTSETVRFALRRFLDTEFPNYGDSREPLTSAE
jgi:hypothetical protein